MKKRSLLFLFTISLFVGTRSIGQTTNFNQLTKVYTSLKEALKEPLKVYRLNLSGLPVDSFPIDLSKFKNLEHLYLNYDHLEFIPKEIADLQNLKVLQLNGDNFKTLPPEFSKLKNLQEIYLNADKKIDLSQNVKVLSNLPKLRILHLEGDNLSSLPPNFSMLSHLEKLYLGNNKFTSVPLQIKDIKTLKYLDIRNNNVPAIKKEDYKTFGYKINF